MNTSMIWPRVLMKLTASRLDELSEVSLQGGEITLFQIASICDMNPGCCQIPPSIIPTSSDFSLAFSTTLSAASRVSRIQPEPFFKKNSSGVENRFARGRSIIPSDPVVGHPFRIIFVAHLCHFTRLVIYHNVSLSITVNGRRIVPASSIVNGLARRRSGRQVSPFTFAPSTVPQLLGNFIINDYVVAGGPV